MDIRWHKLIKIAVTANVCLTLRVPDTSCCWKIDYKIICIATEPLPTENLSITKQIETEMLFVNLIHLLFGLMFH